jgi:manganese transport protein
MGEHVNGQVLNSVALVYLVIILAAALAAIPLMIITGNGQ